MSNPDPDGCQNPAQPCARFPVVTTRGRAALCPLPPPHQYSLDLTECRSAIWAGWLGRQTPAAIPATILSWGEAWAAGGAGLREEVTVSVLSPDVGDKRGARPQADKQGISALPPEGPRPLLLPRATLGQMLLNL